MEVRRGEDTTLWQRPRGERGDTGDDDREDWRGWIGVGMDMTLTNLVNQTSLTLQQALDSWHKTQAQIVNSINHWNLYGSYVAKYEEQE